MKNQYRQDLMHGGGTGYLSCQTLFLVFSDYIVCNPGEFRVFFPEKVILWDIYLDENRNLRSNLYVLEYLILNVIPLLKF